MMAMEADGREGMGQLGRYAEDFGKLYLDYVNVRSQIDLLCRDRNIGMFAQVFLRAPSAIMVMAPDGTVQATNPAFTRITGYGEAEVLGKNPDVMASDRHDARFYRKMRLQLAGYGEWQGDIWLCRKDAEVCLAWLHIVAVRNAEGAVLRFVAIFHDVETNSNMHARIYAHASHDPLTGLPNRLLCMDRLQQAIAHARRDSGIVGLLFIDLDRFKQANDTYGHAVGDQLLIGVSKRIVANLRGSDTAARLGGDEFAVVLPGIAGEGDMQLVAGKIITSLQEPFSIEKHVLYVGASVGMALYPANGGTAGDLMHQADMAMYAAKSDGGNIGRLYDVALMLEHRQRLDIEAALRQALPLQQLSLAYQPQIRHQDGKVVGVEALLRWHWPELGEVPPDRFIPIAEATGMISSIGEWALNAACAQQAAWRRMGAPEIRMAVNIFARQLGDPAFPDMVAAILYANDTPPEMLELEVLETDLSAGEAVGLGNLARLRALGVMVTADEFGAGYSSLGRLGNLPVDRIKIGKTFVADMHRNRVCYATVHAIIAMAHAFGIEVLANGVDCLEQAQLLSGFMCKESQGFLYGKPQSAESITALLTQQ